MSSQNAKYEKSIGYDDAAPTILTNSDLRVKAWVESVLIQMECKNPLFGVSYTKTEEIEDEREAKTLFTRAKDNHFETAFVGENSSLRFERRTWSQSNNGPALAEVTI